MTFRFLLGEFYERRTQNAHGVVCSFLNYAEPSVEEGGGIWVKSKVDTAPRTSQVVPHPSTERACQA
jgi:hypothetical protein